MATLTLPTEEEARHFMRTVDNSQAFVGTVMSPSAGSRAARLLSLKAVEEFLEVRTIEDFQAVGLRMDIHYADFGFLAQWVEEVIGDTELAGAISQLHESGEAFGLLAPQVKALLQERQQQCSGGVGAADAHTLQDAPREES